jgi:hypothetical protein
MEKQEAKKLNKMRKHAWQSSSPDSPQKKKKNLRYTAPYHPPPPLHHHPPGPQGFAHAYDQQYGYRPPPSYEYPGPSSIGPEEHLPPYEQTALNMLNKKDKKPNFKNSPNAHAYGSEGETQRKKRKKKKKIGQDFGSGFGAGSAYSPATNVFKSPDKQMFEAADRFLFMEKMKRQRYTLHMIIIYVF